MNRKELIDEIRKIKASIKRSLIRKHEHLEGMIRLLNRFPTNKTLKNSDILKWVKEEYDLPEYKHKKSEDKHY